MVKYLCEVCETRYPTEKEAKDCEEKPLIGPEVKSGLVLEITNPKNYFLFFSQKGFKNHERTYETYSFGLEEGKLWYCIDGISSGSEIDDCVKKGLYKKVSDEQLNKINEIVLEKSRLQTTPLIDFLERLKLEKFHNECNFLD
ncbi:MAG: hypothetical protein WC812_02245 [Candidatus Pacearchaeota archaeon]|jgi:hypothetical protein